MSEWIDVAAEGELAPGEPKIVYTDDAAIAVFNVDGEYYAVEDLCTHDGGELAGGEVEGCEVICPRHGARFSLKTGEVLAPPAYEPILTYPVRIREGRVEVCSEPND